MRVVPLLLVLLMPSILPAAEGSPEAGGPKKTKAGIKEVIRKGILDFREKMGADEEKTRIKVFDRVMPDEALLKKLFGKDARYIWPVLKKGLEHMRQNTARFKEEFDRTGKIRAIELINVREMDVSGRYRKVLKVIPKEIPVYRAIATYDKGGGGSSSYLVVDGKFRFVRGLEAMYEHILKQKEKKAN